MKRTLLSFNPLQPSTFATPVNTQTNTGRAAPNQVISLGIGILQKVEQKHHDISILLLHGYGCVLTPHLHIYALKN